MDLSMFLELVVRIALILGLTGLICMCSRRSGGGFRYALWTIAMLGTLAVPLLGIIIPRWSIGLATPDFVASVDSTVDSTVEAMAGAGMDSTLGIWLLGAWLVVSVLCLGRLGLGFAYVAWLTRQAEAPSDDAWDDAVNRLRSEMNIRRPVRLLSSAAIEAPFTWGWRRPVVMVPSESAAWSRQRRDVVLRHELVHVRRCDWLILMLGSVTRAIYWFHPLVWYAARKLDLECEKACDERVIALGEKPSVYTWHLLAIAFASSKSRLPSAMAISMARGKQIEERVRSVLGAIQPDARGHMSTWPRLMGVIGAVIVLGTAEAWDAPAAATAATTTMNGPTIKHLSVEGANGAAAHSGLRAFLEGRNLPRSGEGFSIEPYGRLHTDDRTELAGDDQDN